MTKQGAKKNKIFVLAEDLTGASELGGIAFQFGLSVKILFATENLAMHDEDVIVIDSNTRNLKPNEAYERITELTSGIDFSEFSLIYKKVDSVLRGPISTELDAFTKVLNCDSTLLIPANPSKKRIIRSGHYFIDDIPLHYTGFRFDPYFPRLSNDVKELITDSNGNVFSSFDNGVSTKNRISIPDISSIEDVKKIAANIAENKVLSGGGADFFREILLEKFGLTEKIGFSDIKLSQTSFVVGSHSVGSRKNLNTLAKKGYAVFRLPKPAIDNSAKFDEWLGKINEALENKIPVAVSGPVKRLEDPVKIGNTGKRIVETAGMLVRKLPEGSLVMMEGGDTASSFFREMKWNTLLISEVHGPGIVALINQDRTIQVVTKPGSYPLPENLFEQQESYSGIKIKKKV